jgi:hypothetical protein
MDISIGKETLKKMYQVCDLVEEKVDLKEKLDLDDEIEFSAILKVDLISFLAYLAASDGVISWRESRYIGELFDVNMTPDKLNRFIMEKDIYSTEFESRPPVTLQILVAFDNAIYNSPVADLFGEELGETLFSLYLILAKGLVESNGRTTDHMDNNEANDLQIYLGMVRKFIDDNTEKHHTDIITGYEKHQSSMENGGIRAPVKNKKQGGAVKAPRKKL